MDRGTYVAVSGSMAQERAMEIISNNLANINTSGFKAGRALFESYLQKHMDPKGDVPAGEGAGKSPYPSNHKDTSYLVASSAYTDFSGGPLRQTGNPLDVALEGEGFLAVMTPEGERYTRGGALKVGPVGELVTSGGEAVLNDKNRPIFVENGNLEILPDGSITVAGVSAGKLKIVDFVDRSRLEMQGNGLLASSDPGNASASDARARQGFLEGSNVNAVAEITRMITAQRTYEAYQKAIQSHDEMTSRLISDVAR